MRAQFIYILLGINIIFPIIIHFLLDLKGMEIFVLPCWIFVANILLTTIFACFHTKYLRNAFAVNIILAPLFFY